MLDGPTKTKGQSAKRPGLLPPPTPLFQVRKDADLSHPASYRITDTCGKSRQVIRPTGLEPASGPCDRPALSPKLRADGLKLSRNGRGQSSLVASTSACA